MLASLISLPDTLNIAEEHPVFSLLKFSYILTIVEFILLNSLVILAVKLHSRVHLLLLMLIWISVLQNITPKLMGIPHLYSAETVIMLVNACTVLSIIVMLLWASLFWKQIKKHSSVKTPSSSS